MNDSLRIGETEIACEINPVFQQVIAARRIVAGGHGIAGDLQAAITADPDTHSGQWGTKDLSRLARRIGLVESDATAFAGTVEVMDLEAGFLENLAFECECEWSSCRDGQADGRFC